MLVIFPSFVCKPDVALLALFRSTTKKDDCPLAVFSKIHSVAGAEVDLAPVNTGPNAFGVGEIPSPTRYRAVVTFRAACEFNLSNQSPNGLRPPSSSYWRTSAVELKGNIYYTIVRDYLGQIIVTALRCSGGLGPPTFGAYRASLQKMIVTIFRNRLWSQPNDVP